ncbi:MAG: hypothetical protein Q8S13_05330 [Dehalococcoidia bacterium]|nr:hypothetical protein [Dehalococcoidia bacterium]
MPCHAGCACHEERRDAELAALRAENENLLRLLSSAYEELRRRGVMSFPVPAPITFPSAPITVGPGPAWVEHKTVPATVGQEPASYLAPCRECERSTTGRCGNHSWPIGYSTPVVR